MTVTVSAEDNVPAGIAKMEYSLDGTNWIQFADAQTSAGVYTQSFTIDAESIVQTFYVRVTDKLGNETTDTEGVYPLVITPESEWRNTDLTLTVKALDTAMVTTDKLEYSFDDGSTWTELVLSRSDVDPGYLFGTLSLTQYEDITFRATYSDGSVFPYEYVAKIDKVDPTMSLAFSTETDWYHWTNQDVTVTVSASDDLSGVAKIEYTFNGSGWTDITDEGSFTLSEFGAYGVKVTDKAGNEVLKGGTLFVDQIAPTMSLAFSTVTDWYNWTNKDVTVTVSASDVSSGVAKIEYTFNGSAWTDITDEGSFTVSEFGAYGVRVTDKAGNEVLQGGTVFIDKGGPTVTLSLDPETDWYHWTNQDVTVTVSTSDTIVGVAKIEYTFNGSGWTDITAAGSFTVSEFGAYGVKVTDNLGNEVLKGGTVFIDKTAPTMSLTFSKETDWYHWTNEDVTVTVSASDTQSGVAKIEYTFNGSAWTDITDEGSFTVSEFGAYGVRVTDKVGNEVLQGGTIFIDKSNPTVSLAFSTETDWYHWTDKDVTVTVSASDAPSGVAKIEYTFKGSNWTDITAAGSFTLSEYGAYGVRVTDKAGNEVLKGGTVFIDKGNPEIKLVSWNKAWTNEDVTVTVSASDAVSGVSKTEYSIAGGAWTEFTKTFSMTGNAAFQVKVTDKAGKATTGDYEMKNIDKVKPEIDSISWDSSWTDGPVTVTVSAHDDLSGLAKMEYSFNGGAWTEFTNTFEIDKDGSFLVRVTDNAGNVEDSDEQTISNITHYTIERDPNTGRYATYDFVADATGDYVFSGEFGNVSGTITVTNNYKTVSGTIKQGVLKIGTANTVSLVAGSTSVAVEVKNGSLYVYKLNINKVLSGTDSSPLLTGDELEDAAMLLQQGAADAALIDLGVDPAADLSAGFDDALKAVAVESALTALSGSEVYYGVDTELDKFSKLNTVSAGLLAS
jgi:hypothetical protein